MGSEMCIRDSSFADIGSDVVVVIDGNDGNGTASYQAPNGNTVTDQFVNFENIVGTNEEANPGTSDTLDFSNITADDLASSEDLDVGSDLSDQGDSELGFASVQVEFAFVEEVEPEPSDTIDGVIIDLDVNSSGAAGTPSQSGGFLDALPAAVAVDGVVPEENIIAELDDFENVIGSDFNDCLFGNNEVNILEGGDGDDLIHGFAGDDFLSGGEGTDTVLFSAAPQGVDVDLNDQASEDDFQNFATGAAAASIFAATGGAGNNVLAGFENVTGSQNDDEITGDDNNNVINGNGGSDLLTGGAGDDTFTGSTEQLEGDTISDFLINDQIIVLGQNFETEDISFDEATNVLSVDTDGDGTADLNINITNDDPDDGIFLAIEDGNNTIITFENDFAAEFQLQEGVALDPAQINGIVNQSLLDGDGDVTFDVGILDLGFASFNNTLGVYEIDPDGNIVDTQILVNNTNAAIGTSVTVENVEAGNTLGLFIIQNGADFADGLSMVDLDNLSFVDANGDPATVTSGPATLAVNGVATTQTVFHSFDPSLNPDGAEHVISGVDAQGTITVGFEDLTGLGDSDFQDVGFTIDVNEQLLG